MCRYVYSIALPVDIGPQPILPKCRLVGVMSGSEYLFGVSEWRANAKYPNRGGASRPKGDFGSPISFCLRVSLNIG